MNNKQWWKTQRDFVVNSKFPCHCYFRRIDAVQWGDRPLVSQCNKGLHEFGNTGQYRKRPIIVTVDWWASSERLNLSYFPDRYKLTSAKGFIEKVSHPVTLTLRKSCHIPCFGLIELLKGFKNFLFITYCMSWCQKKQPLEPFQMRDRDG